MLHTSFHYLWPEMNPPVEGESRFITVLEAFIRREKNYHQFEGRIKEELKELKELIELKLAEKTLGKVITGDFGANIYPPGFGMTYHSWLEAVYEFLSKHSPNRNGLGSEG